MKNLSYILTFFVFIGPEILRAVGWNIGAPQSFTILYPSCYILFLLILTQSKSLYRENQIEFFLVFITLSYWLISKFFLRLELGTMLLINSIALPAMYSIFFSTTSIRKALPDSLRNVVICMFVVNCIMAIVERVIRYNFFPTVVETMADDNELSRSTALLGFPLSNAHFTVIIICFIMISSLSNLKKVFYILLGIVSLFCFNTRAPIVIALAIVALAYLKTFLSRRTSIFSKIKLVLFVIAIYQVVLYLFDLNIAGRFAQERIENDGSIATRFTVFGMLYGLEWTQLLTGMSTSDIADIAARVVGQRHTENWLILFVLNIGIPMTIICLLSFISVFKRTYNKRFRFEWWLCFLSFIITCSTNNSLAWGVQTPELFFICCYAFLNKRRTVIKVTTTK